MGRGYGHLYVDGKFVGAHRVALGLSRGRPLTPDEEALHSCDNPPCCNPGHLFEGTQRQNMDDMSRKGRSGRVTMPERTARGDRNGARLHPERMPRGSANGQSRLTEDAVRTIRDMSSRGMSAVAIGRALAVHGNTVGLVLHGRTWRHVR
jgi:hypothetical protein